MWHFVKPSCVAKGGPLRRWLRRLCPRPLASAVSGGEPSSGGVPRCGGHNQDEPTTIFSPKTIQ